MTHVCRCAYEEEANMSRKRACAACLGRTGTCSPGITDGVHNEGERGLSAPERRGWTFGNCTQQHARKLPCAGSHTADTFCHCTRQRARKLPCTGSHTAERTLRPFSPENQFDWALGCYFKSRRVRGRRLGAVAVEVATVRGRGHTCSHMAWEFPGDLGKAPRLLKSSRLPAIRSRLPVIRSRCQEMKVVGITLCLNTPFLHAACPTFDSCGDDTVLEQPLPARCLTHI
eukprot:364212-Chlamydomonas_euryale.AAC.5